jgi:murein DD-endopeptidase MepM/ murein hydrolase activator NlpD
MITDRARKLITISIESLKALMAELENPAPSAPPNGSRWLIWPSAHRPRVLISPFGVERATFVHEGLDIRAPDGTEIYAGADGIVHKVYVGTFYGKCVVVLHDRPEADYLTYYAHLQEWRVLAGQVVKQGDLIGLADNTGNSSGAHLHLTLVQIGNRAKLRGISLIGCIDPLPHMIEPPEQTL